MLRAADVEQRIFDTKCWRLGDLVIDGRSRRLFRDGHPIDLPQLSWRFLAELVKAAPEVLSVDDLLERVWPGIFVNSETVTQRAKLLRDSLGDDPKNPRYFSVQRGVGYRLIETPVPIASEAPRPPLAKRKGMLAVALVLAAAMSAGAAGYVHWRAGDVAVEEAGLRVAVLPFDNLSSDPADAFIARAIPEIVLNRLSSVRGLAVISRDSSLLGGGSNPGWAAQRLNAAYVVKGSVQRTSDRMRVTCFVVDTATGDRIWSEQFDWPLARLYALQDRIAARVTDALEARRPTLGSLPQRPATMVNSDAYLAYLRGKALLGRFTVAETESAAQQFDRAVRIEPRFPDALVALYDARMQAADLRKEDLGPARARYQPLLDRAAEIDPSSGPLLTAQAMWSPLPRDERIELFRRAIAADPSNARGMTAFAELLEWGNESCTDPSRCEGERLMERVQSIDPLSPRVRFWTVQRQLLKLAPDQLEAEQRKALELDPDNLLLINRLAARRWRLHGETAEGIALMERVIASDPQNPWGPHGATAMYLDVGDPSAAQAVAVSTPASRDSTRPVLALYRG